MKMDGIFFSGRGKFCRHRDGKGEESEMKSREKLDKELCQQKCIFLRAPDLCRFGFSKEMERNRVN